MTDFIKTLFSADGFMPHGHCYLWRPGVLWLHIASDALIALAYFSIPFTMVYFIRRRRDLPFNSIFLCFAAFIVACGTTHLMEIWVIWHPTYWLSGSIKAVTALASVPTAVLLVKLLPQALALPSPSALAAANAELAREIAGHRQAEVDIRRLNDDLERRVAERTRELAQANDVLTREIRDRQLAESDQERLAAIVNSSDDAIVGKTLDGIITNWNAGAEILFGYPAAEAIGRPMTFIFPPERLKEESDILARVAHGESLQHYDTVRVRKDGRRVEVSVTVSPIRDRAGKIVGASKVARDITDRKRAEAEIRRLNSELEARVAQRTAELESANHELEAFSYSVSHDLRAPLRAVNGFAGIVLEDYGGHLPAEGRRYLERVRSGGQRMGELIDDLLAFARLGRQPLARQRVDMGRLVDEVLGELNLPATGRPIETRIADLAAGEGDPALLKQVWTNLLSNAVKYTRGRTPAVVEVGCDVSNGKAVYFVRDNGVGFDMQYASKLFGVFQRLHRPEDFEGTGVGLAIVQRVIQRHGGRVWAEAEPGRGATFHFALAAEA